MKDKLPLFIVTGASGVGKTTIMNELRIILSDFDVLSTDDDNFGTTGFKLEYQDRFNILLHFANRKRNHYLRDIYAVGCKEMRHLSLL